MVEGRGRGKCVLLASERAIMLSIVRVKASDRNLLVVQWMCPFPMY